MPLRLELFSILLAVSAYTSFPFSIFMPIFDYIFHILCAHFLLRIENNSHKPSCSYNFIDLHEIKHLSMPFFCYKPVVFITSLKTMSLNF